MLWLTLKILNKIVANVILEYILFSFKESRLDISCESSEMLSYFLWEFLSEKNE